MEDGIIDFLQVTWNRKFTLWLKYKLVKFIINNYDDHIPGEQWLHP
jgi:hypothetical protein